jgi:hypothetical protein
VTSQRLKSGPFPPNEVSRIAQHVRKAEGRKQGKDGGIGDRIVLPIISRKSIQLIQTSMFCVIKIPSQTQNKLSCGAILTVCSHTFILFWLTKDLWKSQNVWIKFQCSLLVYLCLSSRDIFIFLLEFPLLLLFFCEREARVFFSHISMW